MPFVATLTPKTRRYMQFVHVVSPIMMDSTGNNIRKTS